MNKHKDRLFFLAILMASLPLSVLLTLQPVKTQKMAMGTKGRAVFSLSPSFGTFPVDVPFTLKVFLEMPEPAQVVIAGLGLKFDPKVLQAKEIRGGRDFSNKIKLDFRNGQGKIIIKQGVGGGEPAVSGKVEFAQIDFVGVRENQQTKIVVDKDFSSVVSTASEYLLFEAEPGVYQLK
jgi:hypothetical protein